MRRLKSTTKNISKIKRHNLDRNCLCKYSDQISIIFSKKEWSKTLMKTLFPQKIGYCFNITILKDSNMLSEMMPKLKK